MKGAPRDPLSKRLDANKGMETSKPPSSQRHACRPYMLTFQSLQGCSSPPSGCILSRSNSALILSSNEGSGNMRRLAGPALNTKMKRANWPDNQPSRSARSYAHQLRAYH
eukprot:3037442-Pleurochrysis_carterae.AAC.2